MQRLFQSALPALLVLLGCVPEVADTPAASAPTTSLVAPFPVFIAAYAGNHEGDRVLDVLTQARNAYVLLDPFDAPPAGGWARIVADLRAKGNEVGAYVSVGTGESWREDFLDLRRFLVGEPWEEWGGEYFVSLTDGALPLMVARIDKVASLGFDWVELDNMDWAFDDEARARYGFVATPEEAIAYFRAICAHAHSRGLKCMAKNTVEGADAFDGALYESYADEMDWWDGTGARRFLTEGKPVIVLHYGETDCVGARDRYRQAYGTTLSFLCEDVNADQYVRLER